MNRTADDLCLFHHIVIMDCLDYVYTLSILLQTLTKGKEAQFLVLKWLDPSVDLVSKRCLGLIHAQKKMTDVDRRSQEA